jgi:hypothetical protein
MSVQDWQVVAAGSVTAVRPVPSNACTPMCCSVDGKVVLWRILGQPMLALSLLHWLCLPSMLGWCNCCNSTNSRSFGCIGDWQRFKSFAWLICALFLNLGCWFVYFEVPQDPAVDNPAGDVDGAEAKNCLWSPPGLVVHLYIFAAVGGSVLFGPVVRNSRSVYVFGCLTLLGCNLYGMFGVVQFVHIQHAGADEVWSVWGRECDKLLFAAPLPAWGLYLRSGQ